jgi:hypothetical protein
VLRNDAEQDGGEQGKEHRGFEMRKVKLGQHRLFFFPCCDFPGVYHPQ